MAVLGMFPDPIGQAAADVAGGAVLALRPPPEIDGDVGDQSMLMVIVPLPAAIQNSQSSEAGQQSRHCQQWINPVGRLG